MSVAATVSTTTVLPQWDNSTPNKDRLRDQDPNGNTNNSCANTDHNSVDQASTIMSSLARGDSMKGVGAMGASPRQTSPNSDQRERSSVGDLLSAVKSDVVASGTT